MVVDERVTTNGHDCGLISGVRGPIEATADGNGGLLFDSSGGGGGGSFGEGISADGLLIYTRKKRRKMSDSEETAKNKFNDKIKGSDEPSECSLRHCRKIVLQQMHQSLSGSEDGLQESIRNALKNSESFDCVEKSVDHTHFTSSGSLNGSESFTITELCRRAFFDILMSEKFSELCGLLLKNFGDVNVNRILNVNAIHSRMKNGAYETSPLLYLKDIQQVWMKLQQVGNEMVTLAKNLSDKSRTHYEQFVRKPRATEPCGASSCTGCGEKADVRNSLVCDSCEEIYHVSCTDLIATQIPPKSWYCTSCISNGMGSPHDNCTVCEKLKSAASISLANGPLVAQDPEFTPIGPEPGPTDGAQKVCFVCKSQVKPGDAFRTCGHSLCAHKFYHYSCLTTKQLGVCGPCWYCPSCLCRGCLVDKDDEKIVLCDGCDQAYHIYCTSPALNLIPSGSWFCGKCDRELKRIAAVKRVYEGVKIEDESGGLEMLVTAAKTLSHRETR